MKNYTLSVLVEDKPGVLTRVSGLFARRAYNIVSLAVGPSEKKGLSRITVVTKTTQEALEQIKKQLNKLIQVIEIVQLPDSASVQRDHILVKVSADTTVRAQVAQAVDLFRAHIVDVSPDALIIESTGMTDKLKALLDILEPFGILEIVQSGNIAIARGSFDPSKQSEKKHKPTDNSSQMTV